MNSTWSRKRELKHGWPLLLCSSLLLLLHRNKLYCWTWQHAQKLLVFPQQALPVTYVLNLSVFEALSRHVYLHLSVCSLGCVWSRLLNRHCLLIDRRSLHHPDPLIGRRIMERREVWGSVCGQMLSWKSVGGDCETGKGRRWWARYKKKKIRQNWKERFLFQFVF